MQKLEAGKGIYTQLFLGTLALNEKDLASLEDLDYP